MNKTKSNKKKSCRQVITHESENWMRHSTSALFAPVRRCVRFFRKQREQTPTRSIRTDLGLFRRSLRGRKSKQDKHQASSAPPCSVTSARSAGSYGSFWGVPKWGQNRRGAITSAVVTPRSLLPQGKSRGHAPERSSFLVRKKNLPSISPLRKRHAWSDDIRRMEAAASPDSLSGPSISTWTISAPTTPDCSFRPPSSPIWTDGWARWKTAWHRWSTSRRWSWICEY